MEKTIKNNEKGVSIYLIVIMMSIFLAISLNVAAIIINGAKIVKGAADSVKAFHAADTGVEAALYEVKDGSCPASPFNVTGNVGDAKYTYSVTVTYSSICGGTGTTMSSEGTFSDTGKRKIGISY